MLEFPNLSRLRDPYQTMALSSPQPTSGVLQRKQDDSQREPWSCARVAIIVLYSAVTVLELLRGVIHAFFYDTGINDISGLATGDPLCDNRLSALMIAYGGANLESFAVHAFALYTYATGGRQAKNLLRATSAASALWEVVTRIVSAGGGIDVGDAELPGRQAMLARSIVSALVFLLTFFF